MQEIIINVDDRKDKLIALIENGKLIEKYEELEKKKHKEGNIYIGKVQNILVGMQAAFVDIGEGKNTFIHIRDIIPKASNETGNKNEALSKHDINNYIKSGMPLLVQVKRDCTNKKGARVSTHISFTGRFAVIMPNAKFVTISQKIENKEKRENLKKIFETYLPKGYGAIVRTSAEGQAEEVIKEDINQTINVLENIIKKYNKIKEEGKEKGFKPQLLYKNEGIVKKTLIDLIDRDINRILTNNKEIYEEVKNLLIQTKNENRINLELREKELLTMYDLDNQLNELNNRKIWLKCGGFITIDKTEALTAIDVNSGKYIGNKDLEQTVFTVNKEATWEIAKQLRLRDIGGIIIIDYIDMEKQETKDKIKEILIESLKKDRSKTQVIGFTPLDLLEMTRKHMCSND